MRARERESRHPLTPLPHLIRPINHFLLLPPPSCFLSFLFAVGGSEKEISCLPVSEREREREREKMKVSLTCGSIFHVWEQGYTVRYGALMGATAHLRNIRKNLKLPHP